jgi:hypothetical protein
MGPSVHFPHTYSIDTIAQHILDGDQSQLRDPNARAIVHQV